jgi:hypothetical protein
MLDLEFSDPNELPDNFQQKDDSLDQTLADLPDRGLSSSLCQLLVQTDRDSSYPKSG